MKRLTLVFLALVPFLISCDSLYASEVQANIHLEWTATGDDGNDGQATAYDLRYTTDTTLAFESWVEIDGEPAPSIAGIVDSINFPLTLEVGTSYFFAIRACDEVPNCGIPSNYFEINVPDTLKPGQIIDLRGSFSGVAQ